MATVYVDPGKVFEFQNAQAFYKWLRAHHRRESEVWIKIHKVASGLPSITPKEAIDVALCWGWIDAIRKAYDDKSYLQRYTPRGPKSTWSRINVANVARLIEEGRMTAHGLRPVELAKADGRWDRAYASGKDMVLPADLLAAIEAEPKASKTLARLSAQNRFAMGFRLHNMKTEAGRKGKIASFVQMLKKGEAVLEESGKSQENSMKKSGSTQDQPASELIDRKIAELGDWRAATLGRMRELIHEADPAVVEEWKWGTPVWSHDGILCTGETYKAKVKLTFAKGASLKDPAKLFNSSLEGNTRRALDIGEGEAVDAAAFKALIRAAVALNTASAKPKRAK